MTTNPSGPTAHEAATTGRDRELRIVAQEFAATLDGGTRAVLLTGEPGIGKSWVLTRAAQRASSSHDARVLDGYALDLQGTPPHYPLSRAFAALPDGWPRGATPWARAILASAGIGPPAPDMAGPAAMSPEAGQLRVFDALTEVCAALAASRPLILLLDDMQWAAAFTWHAVQYLLRAFRGPRLFVLLAAREEVLLQPRSEAARTVAELQRLRLLTHLPLQPLGREAITTLSTARLGGRVSDELSALLTARSEGNPFFAEEILRDYQERGLLLVRERVWHLATHAAGEHGTVPSTLHLAIGVRLDRLPDGCEEALAAAAVLGRSFAARTLASMLGCGRGELAQRMRAAELAGLVQAEQAGWRFRHDTVREALIGRHLASAQTLHAAAAAAIGEAAANAPGFETLAALAHHWQLAADPANAGPAALAAARAATSTHALGEALSYARNARRLCEEAHDQLSDDVLAEAVMAHGDAALVTGAYAEAADAFRALQQLGVRLNDAGLEGVAWLRLGNALRRQELPSQAAACYDEALRRLDEETQGSEVAETLIALCDLKGLTLARYGDAREAGERALAIARRLGDRGIEARATLALANAETRAEDPATARSLLAGALEHALAAGDLVLAAEICGGLANGCYWTGEIRRSQVYAEQRLELARRAAEPFALRHAHSWLALLAATRGEWDEAGRLLEESEHALAGLDNPEPIAFLRVVRGLVAFRLGALDEAYAQLRAALSTLEQLGDETALWYAGLLALVCAELGRKDEARAIAAAQEHRLAGLDVSALPARSARCTLGLVYARLADREAAARCETAVQQYAADFHWSPARRTLAALAALRGATAGALEHLVAAEAHARHEGLGPDLALILLERARLSPPRERHAPLDEARALLSRLRMQRELAEAEALAAPSPPPGLPAGLSAREIEVLRLIAQGKTNREVASALVISERTVANHLSNIFTKIAVDNRAAAAAFAFRNGIVEGASS